MQSLPRHFAYRSSGKEVVFQAEVNAVEQKLQVIIQSESFPLDRQQLAQEKDINKKAVLPITCCSLDLVDCYGRIQRFADLDLTHPIIPDARHP